MNKFKLSLLGLAAVVAVGCGGSEVTANAPVTTVRVVHASGNTADNLNRTTNIDAFVNGGGVANNAAFGQVSPYVNPNAGTVTVQVTPANNPNNVILAATLNLLSGPFYQVFAVGSPTDNPNSLTAVTTADNGASPGVGNAKIRVIHGAGNAVNVDVFLANAADALPVAPNIANLPFSGQAPAFGDPALVTTSGNKRLRITQAGVPGNILFNNDNFALGSEADVTLVAVKRTGGGNPNPPLELLVVPLASNTTSILGNNP